MSNVRYENIFGDAFQWNQVSCQIVNTSLALVMRAGADTVRVIAFWRESNSASLLLALFPAKRPGAKQQEHTLSVNWWNIFKIATGRLKKILIYPIDAPKSKTFRWRGT